MNILVIIIAVIAVLAVIRAFALSPEQKAQVRKQVENDIASQMEKANKATTEVQTKEEPQYDYYSFNVVGMKYRTQSVKKLIDRISRSEHVELEPEPRNQYDKNAIKVLVFDDYKMKDVCIGYVPADEATEIKQLIEDNPQHECSIDYLSCDLDDDYFSISVVIKY